MPVEHTPPAEGGGEAPKKGRKQKGKRPAANPGLPQEGENPEGVPQDQTTPTSSEEVRASGNAPRRIGERGLSEFEVVRSALEEIEQLVEEGEGSVPKVSQERQGAVPKSKTGGPAHMGPPSAHTRSRTMPEGSTGAEEVLDNDLISSQAGLALADGGGVLLTSNTNLRTDVARAKNAWHTLLRRVQLEMDKNEPELHAKGEHGSLGIDRGRY